jgi:hypothetical protein
LSDQTATVAQGCGRSAFPGRIPNSTNHQSWWIRASMLFTQGLLGLLSVALSTWRRQWQRARTRAHGRVLSEAPTVNPKVPPCHYLKKLVDPDLFCTCAQIWWSGCPHSVLRGPNRCGLVRVGGRPAYCDGLPGGSSSKKAKRSLHLGTKFTRGAAGAFLQLGHVFQVTWAQRRHAWGGGAPRRWGPPSVRCQGLRPNKFREMRGRGSPSSSFIRDQNDWENASQRHSMRVLECTVDSPRMLRLDQKWSPPKPTSDVTTTPRCSSFAHNATRGRWQYTLRRGGP